LKSPCIQSSRDTRGEKRRRETAARTSAEGVGEGERGLEVSEDEPEAVKIWGYLCNLGA